LVDVLGLDIGGANTKAVFVTVKAGKIQQAKSAVEYLPIWKTPKNLPATLSAIKNKLCAFSLDGVGVTMTAELSDAYKTKREGVNHILSSVKRIFPDIPIFVLNTDAKLQSVEDSIREPLIVASANWAATGWLISQYVKNAVVIDVGSTSTSIIPIINNKIAACGRTDLDKLVCGELVYTGSLRTNLATIVQSVPMKMGIAGVSSEVFALSGDIHLLLGHILEKDYTSETADGRGKTINEALSRIARLICADTEIVSEQEIIEIATYIYEKQVAQIADGLSKVYARVKSLSSGKVAVVVTGLGKNFLARKAAEHIGTEDIEDLGAVVGDAAVFATPAFGVALMTQRKIEEEENNSY
jgi:(4-(4-[2-(gamma-L-glutamylamino)ethyl]phenoxymethyl)furan-2-yl)methanamine synthase